MSCEVVDVGYIIREELMLMFVRDGKGLLRNVILLENELFEGRCVGRFSEVL